MAMPTVMIGLILYGLLSRQGPLGSLGLLYSETAVILGEAVLIFPIVMNLTMVAVHTADPLLLPTLKSLGANTRQQIQLVLLQTLFLLGQEILIKVFIVPERINLELLPTG